MAKIYETKDDFQRDVLDAQAKDLRLRSEKQASNGLGLIGLSFAPAVFKLPGWLNIAGSIAGFVGIIDVVRSWFTGSKAHSLELQRDQLGPQRIVLPSEVPLPGTTVSEEKPVHSHTESCGCKHKKLAGMMAPKSLTDFAEKTTDIANVER